ncbi:cysteine desulfurase [Roseibium denhamense]|uniref:Cysteine desulfurase n=1 Tax=Roseibium denhamense TaxID=76305 RepID=A0ABY1PE43_9HYPH|nr:cysteine desulfurase family protein [Roseibium denhamense]MTI06188.1 cysteine desulfurase [Roseibium denhamense]SMP32437.1 cysteine desulfurase [Roseibium denhamense]
MPGQASPVYLDHNAGAPMRPAVRDAVIEVLQDAGNASSVHAHGRKARGRIENAREQVAKLCGAFTRAVTFVSGGTEANMTALSPSWQDQGEPVYLDKLFRSAVEHPSVVTGGRFRVADQVVIPVDSNGVIDLEALEDRVSDADPSLISVMAANNETGVIQPLEGVGAIAAKYGHFFHVDAVQAAGRMPINMGLWQADAVTLSAHKFGGPQGIGAVVVRSTARVPSPLMVGGGQENWRRGGTENVSAIAGFGVAASAALEDLNKIDQMKMMKARLETGLVNTCPSLTIFGADAERLVNTTCFAVPGISAETALIALDLERVSLSSGSACSSGKVSVSHVLSAMGVEEDTARCALRISMGWNTEDADIDRFLDVWPRVVDRLNPDARHRAA